MFRRKIVHLFLMVRFDVRLCFFKLFNFFFTFLKPEENNIISSTVIKIGYPTGTCVGYNVATHLYSHLHDSFALTHLEPDRISVRYHRHSTEKTTMFVSIVTHSCPSVSSFLLLLPLILDILHTSSCKIVVVSKRPLINVGKSTIMEAAQDVVNVLYDQQNQYNKFPTTIAETTECIATFQRTRSELPNVVGAIDGTHIPIIAPRIDAVDYFSRYQQHDMIVQGVVNGTGKFIDAVAGFPWSAHDARVLRNSNIYQEAENGNILQAPLVNIDGNDIAPYLVGDSDYPLAPWLIKPFPEGTNDPDEKTFNKELSRARVVVERAFGILKRRWRVLQKRLDSSLNFAIKTTIACIVLRNFCIEAKAGATRFNIVLRRLQHCYKTNVG